jgi:hypothetical protein
LIHALYAPINVNPGGGGSGKGGDLINQFVPWVRIWTAAFFLSGPRVGIFDTFKPVFHFKRTIPKRIKNVFKFQNFVNVDWLVSTSIVRQKVDLRQTFNFDTRIHPEVCGFINIFNLHNFQFRFGTVQAKWKTCLTLTSDNTLKKPEPIFEQTEDWALVH